MDMHLDYAALERRRWEGSDAGSVHGLAFIYLTFSMHIVVTGTLNTFARPMISEVFHMHQ